MGFFDIFDDAEAPAPRSLAQEGRDTLQAQIDLAPQQYEMRAKYDPLYAALASRTKAASVAGDLDIYSSAIPRLTDLQALANTGSRRADIGDVTNLGPGAYGAIRGYNPNATRILDTLTTQAQDELDAGATLDPSLRREVMQGVRQGQAARGMGFGTRDLSEEIFGIGSAAQALRDRRRAFASGVLGQNQSFYGDPFQTIVGRSSGAIPTAMSIPGAGSGGAPTFDPFNSYAQDLYSSNYNADYNMRAANQSKNAAILGGLFGMTGNLGRGAMAAWGNGGGSNQRTG